MLRSSAVHALSSDMGPGQYPETLPSLKKDGTGRQCCVHMEDYFKRFYFWSVLLEQLM